MFRFFEQSLIMSVAIVLVAALVKILRDKVRPAKRYLCYVILFAALFIPYRPNVFTVTVAAPMPEIQHTVTPAAYSMIISETYEADPLPIRGFDAVAAQTREIMQYWSRFRAGSIPIFSREAYYLTTSYFNLIEGYTNATSSVTNANIIPWRYLTMHQLLLGIWVAGILVLLAVSVIKYIRFIMALKRHSTPIQNGTAYEILRRIRRSLKLRRKIRLWSNPVATVPVMFGLFRPTIVLPEYEAYVDEDKLHMFILHEALHIKRRDIATKILCIVATALHWFNPLVYWLNHRISEECERACDEAVIEFMGTENRFNYSQTLLFAAKQSHGLKKAVLSYALSDDGKRMKGRLVNIMNNVTPNRWVLITCTALLLTMAMIFSLISCGHNNDDYEPSSAVTGGGPTPQNAGANDLGSIYVIDVVRPGEVPAFDREQFVGETLTIYTAWAYHIRSIAEGYMLQNPGVSIKISCFSPNYERGIEQILAQGYAPVLLDSTYANHPSLSNILQLADWSGFMNADPEFNDDIYFMNVFDALKVNNRLYNFPLAFSFSMMAANNTIPGLANTLGWYNSLHGGITMSQLLELRHTYSVMGGDMHFEYNFTVAWGMHGYLHNFIDLETRRVDFNNQRFIDFIVNSREATGSDKGLFYMRGTNFSGPQWQYNMSQQYFFYNIGYGTSMLAFFLDLDGVFIYLNPTPVVNDRGELVIHQQSAFALNAEATPVQQALAWDFMRFASGNALGGYGSYSQSLMFGMPVNRNALRFAINRDLPQVLSMLAGNHGGWNMRPIGTRQEALETAVARLTIIGEMPMISTQLPPLLSAIFNEELADFHYGYTMASETAYNLQERITSALDAR